MQNIGKNGLLKATTNNFIESGHTIFAMFTYCRPCVADE